MFAGLIGTRRLGKFGPLLSGLFILLTLAAQAARAQEVQTLSWADLIPKLAPFDDPFLSLPVQQKRDLALVARARGRQSSPNTPDMSLDESLKAAVERLTSAHVDIDALLARRSHVAEKRREAAEAANENLNGRLVQISGYVLPLRFENEKATEFLLVPYVGACIHEPRPNANQIIRVAYPKGLDLKGRFDAVLVRGRIRAANGTPHLWLVDGAATVPTAYALDAQAIEPFARQEEAAPVSGMDRQNPASLGDNSNPFRRAQKGPHCVECEKGRLGK